MASNVTRQEHPTGTQNVGRYNGDFYCEQGKTMEAIRMTVNSAQLTGIIDLPTSMCGQEVEVIVLPCAENNTVKTNDEKPRITSVMGILKEYANPALREMEEGAWERAAAEKYMEKKRDGRS